MEIKISLSRKKKTLEGYSWKEYSLKQEEYFDLDMLEEDEKLDIDSIPLYSRTIDYLYKFEKENFKEEDIVETKIMLSYRTKTKILSEKLWNDGNNCLIERMDLYPDYYFNLLIIGTRVGDKFDETIRIEKSVGMETFDIVMHSISDAKTEDLIYSYSGEKYKTT
ncbi:MAG: hypothetical protein LBJ67_15050 [Planctomycetaceae bacterium]|jgi:hypothetical protein|nr:hypothetical protein [Planctomycetaceae bacterium]